MMGHFIIQSDDNSPSHTCVCMYLEMAISHKASTVLVCLSNNEVSPIITNILVEL